MAPGVGHNTKARATAALLLSALTLLLLPLSPAPAVAAAPPMAKRAPPALLGPRRPALSTANGTTNRLAPPTVDCVGATQTSIRVEVCPGNDHPAAPYGFRVQWSEINQFLSDGGWPCPPAPASDAICAARTATDEVYHDTDDCWAPFLGAGPEQGVTYRPPGCAAESLLCGTSYAVRAFVLGGASFNGSLTSEGVLCSTLPCEEP